MAELQIKDFAIENVISGAIQIPGVKVDRRKFLSEWFAKEDVNLNDVVEYGPIAADCSPEMLSRLAGKLILDRTSKSSMASFVAGIPGGIAMAATIPADLLQFFGMSLRVAQELSYLYGAGDLWKDGTVDSEKVNSQLIMYCGVMFGVSIAISGVRFLSSQLAKQTLKKLPQKALTKTFWYPIVKQVGKAIGIKVTKNTVAKGISKAVPIVGGVISGGLNFASMLPMGKRLAETLHEANFDYTEEEAVADYEVLVETGNAIDVENENIAEQDENKKSINFKDIGKHVSGFVGKLKKNIEPKKTSNGLNEDDIFAKIEKLTKLKDIGAISEDEFETKKAELLAKI